MAPMIQRSLFLLLLIVFCYSDDICDSLSYNDNSDIKYFKLEDVAKCISVVHFDDPSIPGLILTNIEKMMKFYVFREIVASSPSSGPFQSIKVNVTQVLNELQTKNWTNSSSFDFYQQIQDQLFTPLSDSNTQFSKPSCYDSYFFQPWILTASVQGNKTEGARVKILIESERAEVASIPFWSSFVLNKNELEVVSINGKSAYDFILDYSSQHPSTKDSGVNFNDRIKSFTRRETRSGEGQINIPSTLTWVLSDGSTHEVPWAITWKGDLSMCESQTVNKRSPHTNADGYDDVSVLTSVTDSLVLRMKSFESQVSSSAAAKLKWNTNGQRNLVLDVRGNTKGTMCEAWRTVQLLRKNPKPFLFDMMHSDPLDRLVDAASKNPEVVTPFSPSQLRDPTSSNDSPFSSFYGPIWHSRGGLNRQYSKMYQYSEQMCASTPITEFRGEFENIIIVSDGKCSGPCAMFATQLANENSNVLTVSLGGTSSQPKMSFVTSAGGLVQNVQDIINYFTELNLGSDEGVPVQWRTDVSMTVTFTENYLMFSNQNPLDFQFNPASHKISMWSSADTLTNEQYNQVVDIVGAEVKRNWLLIWCLVGGGSFLLSVLLISGIILVCRRRRKYRYTRV